MKKTDLVEIIRTVVREEINNSLPQFLMEVLAEKITNGQSALVENKAAAPAPVAPRAPVATRRGPVVMLDEPFKRSAAPVPKIITKNPALNAVLAETVGGVPDEADTPSAVDVLNNLPQEVLAENTAVAAVAQAMNRDYSAILKAADEKAKRNRPA